MVNDDIQSNLDSSILYDYHLYKMYSTLKDILW